MAQLEERKVVSPPPFPVSPSLPPAFPSDYPPEYGEESSKAFGKCREPDYASQYSPWSCDTIGSYIGSKDAKPKDHMTPGAMEMMTVDGKGLRDPSLEAPRRAAEGKDDDPIIPFGPQPTVSRFGAISRTSKAGYQGGPLHPMGPGTQPPSKHMALAAEYSYGNHGGWGGASYPAHQQVSSPQTHFPERVTMGAADKEQLKMELQQINQQISQQSQMHGMEAAGASLLLQRESGPQGPPQQQWPAGGSAGASSQQLSMELHQVEREIGKRTREMEGGHELQYKMKTSENGQPDHKITGPAMVLGEVSNGSGGLGQDGGVGGAMLSLTNKTSSLSMTSDQGPAGAELQKNGVVHPCS